MSKGQKMPIELLDEGQIDSAINLYCKIKNENPSDFYVSENRFNSLGYSYLGQSEFKKAIAIFKLNTEFYPESGNCYDSLGEAFMNIGDNKQAIINYKKALELNPNNQNAAIMLEKLVGVE
jgi:tetratricopeptide (TPR) repeat protein